MSRGQSAVRESERHRGEIQPIRDEMELLESERRILSPGCCTGKRQKGGEREGGERELRTMHHAILLFYPRREGPSKDGTGRDRAVIQKNKKKIEPITKR